MENKLETIFISHAHADKEYVKELVDLIKGIGFTNILCSSYPGHGVPQDSNIYDYLKNKLQGNVWVIFLLSRNYYLSAACLNEMGASWVLNKCYTTILIPTFEYREIKGAIDAGRVTFKLNEKTGLNDFKRNLAEKLKLDPPNDNVWENMRDQVIQNVSSLSDEERRKNKLARVEFESVNHKGEGEITVGLRFINDNDFPIEFNLVEATLTDEKNNSFNIKLRSPNIKLNHKENRIIFRDFMDADSKYDSLIHSEHNIDWRFNRAYL